MGRTRPIRYISLFSGMEAASCAFEKLGLDAEPVAFAEIDPVASAFLAQKFPHVPNHGDVSAFDWSVYRGQVDIILGGSPCQSFSVAGKRLGLDDPRGNLALHFLRVVRDTAAPWFFYENVPGMLSADGSEAFASFLGTVDELGYCGSWAVLDARFFGTAQRRRRLFVVGRAGDDWRAPAAVLFEPESQGWNSGKDGPARKGVAASSGRSTEAVGAIYRQTNFAEYVEDGTASTRMARDYKGGGNDVVLQPVAFQSSQSGVRISDAHATLDANNGSRRHNGVIYAAAPPKLVLRRLTPLETLRLQGFPDDWFDGITFRGKPLTDSQRYKMIGNSWCINVVSWILNRMVPYVVEDIEAAEEPFKLAAD